MDPIDMDSGTGAGDTQNADVPTGDVTLAEQVN